MGRFSGLVVLKFCMATVQPICHWLKLRVINQFSTQWSKRVQSLMKPRLDITTYPYWCAKRKTKNLYCLFTLFPIHMLVFTLCYSGESATGMSLLSRFTCTMPTCTMLTNLPHHTKSSFANLRRYSFCFDKTSSVWCKTFQPCFPICQTVISPAFPAFVTCFPR